MLSNVHAHVYNLPPKLDSQRRECLTEIRKAAQRVRISFSGGFGSYMAFVRMQEAHADKNGNSSLPSILLSDITPIFPWPPEKYLLWYKLYDKGIAKGEFDDPLYTNQLQKWYNCTLTLFRSAGESGVDYSVVAEQLNGAIFSRVGGQLLSCSGAAELLCRITPRQVSYNWVISSKFSKDVDELRTYDMDIRKVISDATIKDFLNEGFDI